MPYTLATHMTLTLHTHTPLTLHPHTNVPHTPPTHVPHTPPTHMSLILHSYMCPSHSTQTHLTPTVPFIYNNIYLFIRLTVQMDEFWLCNCKFCNIKYNNEKILYTISYQVCNMWKRHENHDLCDYTLFFCRFLPKISQNFLLRNGNCFPT